MFVSFHYSSMEALSVYLTSPFSPALLLRGLDILSTEESVLSAIQSYSSDLPIRYVPALVIYSILIQSPQGDEGYLLHYEPKRDRALSFTNYIILHQVCAHRPRPPDQHLSRRVLHRAQLRAGLDAAAAEAVAPAAHHRRQDARHHLLQAAAELQSVLGRPAGSGHYC